MSGPDGRLAGRVALVTGAATGLGREIARLYAREGASVVCADIRASEAEQTCSEIVAEGGVALFAEVDVSSKAAVDAVVERAERELGALHVLAANAGILGRSAGKPITEVSDDEVAEVMNVNFLGVLNSFRAAIPAIRRAGGGTMTATTSLAAHRGYASLPIYGASKGAVVALVRAVAAEVAPDIRVNAVSAGSMRTEIVEHALEAGAEAMATSLRPPAAEAFNRIAAPSEVARAHLFLASDDASFVNGVALIVDGGKSMLA
jgi:NAD(P)-dependent dehydrogenase (short-subunit alcohol dehydrogenase family)